MRLQWIIAILAFSALLPITYASIDAKHFCADRACLEGTDINFSVLVYNNLNQSITIDNLYIKDMATGQILAIDARKEIIVLSGDAKEFNIPSVVKAPESGYTFYYVPCFTAKEFNDEGVKATGEVCGKNIQSLTVVPLKDVQCRTDAECQANEYCNTYSLFKCKPVECFGNQTIINHKCYDLQCDSLQYAKNHRCVYNDAIIYGIGLIIFIIAIAVVVIIVGRSRKMDVKSARKKTRIKNK